MNYYWYLIFHQLHLTGYANCLMIIVIIHWTEFFGCKYLRCLFISKNFRRILSLSLESYCLSLQQLYIYSIDTVPTESFIDALCGHGGLEHVILYVKSLTARSIMNIIEHSSNLVTFVISLCCRSRIRPFTSAQLKQLTASIKTTFSKRKLFNGGNFELITSKKVIDNRLMYNTELLSVWDSNNDNL